ncbi:MBL fold metallo-hydrolase [Porticoccaceae bacterium]|nr:MBL fold metallo-hydrolase [Porticoccaceae bacterium]
MNSSLASRPATQIDPSVTAFFDQQSNTFSYVVQDPTSNACAIIDSVLDFDYASGHFCFIGADAIKHYIQSRNLQVEWHIETHVHADHLSAAPYLQQQLGGKLAIGEQIISVQKTFGSLFNEGTEFQRDGSQFDRLLADGDSYQIGNMAATALHTPGHTPACMVHVVGNAAFVGDTIFMPDAGTARADFPGGCAGTLYHSVQKILSLPSETRLYLCHDYGPNGREVDYQTTVAEQCLNNIHVNNAIAEDQFVQMRETRDKTLGMPTLIMPAIQTNMRGGHFPAAESNGVVYLKVPVNVF